MLFLGESFFRIGKLVEWNTEMWQLDSKANTEREKTLDYQKSSRITVSEIWIYFYELLYSIILYRIHKYLKNKIIVRQNYFWIEKYCVY